jgi:hypothetical protein
MVTAQDTTTYVVTVVMNLLVLAVHHLSMVYSGADDARRK